MGPRTYTEGEHHDHIAVTNIHRGDVVESGNGESFGDGTGDTITVHPVAGRQGDGGRVPVADLVLLRRAEA